MARLSRGRDGAYVSRAVAVAGAATAIGSMSYSVSTFVRAPLLECACVSRLCYFFQLRVCGASNVGVERCVWHLTASRGCDCTCEAP